MRLFVCGNSGKRLHQALDHLHQLFNIQEVIHGASQRKAGVDLAASSWVDQNQIPYRIAAADRAASQIPMTNPDLILIATSTGNSHVGARRWGIQLSIPVLILHLDGELRTVGRGWGPFLKRFIRVETETRLRKVVG